MATLFNSSYNDPNASENLRIYNDYSGALAKARKRSALNESFYMGKQYSRREQKQMSDVGLIPIVINIVRPFMSIKRAHLTSSRPTWKVVPLNGGTKLISDALNQILIGKWNSDYTDVQTNLVIRDVLVAGYGCFFIDIASFLDNATFDVLIKKIGWRYVYPDPDAQEYDAQDSENIIIYREISLKKAKVIYRLTDEECRESLSVSGTIPDNAMVPVIERFSKYPIIEHVVTKKKDVQSDEFLPQVFFTHNLTDIVGKEQEAAQKEAKELLAKSEDLAREGKVDLRRLDKLHIHRCTSVGNLVRYNGVMNIRDYPTIIMVNEYGQSFKDYMSEVAPLEGIQKSLNKFYGLTLHNAMLSGNVRAMGPKDAIEDKKAFQRTAATPGAYISYNPDPSLPNGGKPEIVHPLPLSSAFYALANDLVERGRFQTNVFGPVQGDPRHTPETFSTASSLQEFGTAPIKELARRIDIGIAKAGEVMIQYVQNYSRADELIEFIDIEGNLRGPVDPNTGQEIRFNKYDVKEAVIKEIKNNSRIGQYAVKVLTQPNLGTHRMTQAAVIRDMIMNKAIPAIPGLISRMLDLMEFPNAVAVGEELKQSADATRQLSALKQQNEELQTILRSKSQENVKLSERVYIEQFKTLLLKELERIKSTGKSTAQDLQHLMSIIEDTVEKAESSSTLQKGEE